MPEWKLVTLDPGHFHAGLIQKEMYPQVSRRVHVYAPLGPDLAAHAARIARFNTRAENPTAWELEIHASPDFLGRLLEERPGNVVVMSGRNRGKIDRILACLEAGLNVLADKPWIVVAADLAKVERALDLADGKGLVAYDIMTERFEITSILLRELLGDPEVFGEAVAGDRDNPGVSLRSVHHIMKMVAGAPNLRPPWFFDIEEQGEGLADVGTHLADLVSWTLFPRDLIDWRAGLEVFSAQRWPTVIDQAQFERVTGCPVFPACLEAHVRNGRLDYYCNNSVSYAIGGIHARLEAVWDWEAPPGAGDTYVAAFRGSKARLEVRQGREENFRSEVYVVPEGGAVREAVRARIGALQTRWPGVTMEPGARQIRLAIPDRYRTSHETHFSQVTNEFFGYLDRPGTLAAWEKPNMLAKYRVTTAGVGLAQAG